MSPSIYLSATAFVGVLGLVYAVTLLTGRRGAATHRRLDEHAVPVALNEAKRLERVDVLIEQRYSSSHLMEAVLRRLRPARTAAIELTRADVPLGVPVYLLARCFLAGILYVAVDTAIGIPLLPLAAIPVGLMLPRLALLHLGRRRHAAFEGQLAEGIDLIVGAMRAGYGFLQAIESTAKEIPDPMSGELARVIDHVNVGATVAEALLEMPKRIASYDLSLFVTAVTVQRTIGGNLAEVLENIAETVRERRRIRAEVMAITTGPRMSSYVLGLFPLGLLIFFIFVDANYRAVMLHERAGHIMLGVAGTWSLIGLVLSTKVSKVEY
jgi:tight adherence protein B